MRFLLITLAVGILTLLSVFFFGADIKKRPAKVGGYKIHHSVWGILLLVVGLLVSRNVIAPIGLGIYLSHVVEEIYFNQESIVKAFFVFITGV